MADADAEFARFEAELRALEAQPAAEPSAPAAGGAHAGANGRGDEPFANPPPPPPGGPPAQLQRTAATIARKPKAAVPEEPPPAPPPIGPAVPEGGVHMALAGYLGAGPAAYYPTDGLLARTLQDFGGYSLPSEHAPAPPCFFPMAPVQQYQGAPVGFPGGPPLASGAAAATAARAAAAGGAAAGAAGAAPGAGKRSYMRTVAGEKWEDRTLGEWPENDFRCFVGDLGKDVSDDVLARAFAKYGTFAKAKVVKDKVTGNTKGFGFVSFLTYDDFAAALREMDGKYVGSRPIKIYKSSWEERQDQETMDYKKLKRVRKDKKHIHLPTQ